VVAWFSDHPITGLSDRLGCLNEVGWDETLDRSGRIRTASAFRRANTLAHGEAVGKC
jgi:hypothetical protein